MLHPGTREFERGKALELMAAGLGELAGGVTEGVVGTLLSATGLGRPGGSRGHSYAASASPAAPAPHALDPSSLRARARPRRHHRVPPRERGE